MEPWREALSKKRDVCVSEQGPGFYKTKFVRGGPVVLIRIMLDHGSWIILVNGETEPDCGTDDPWDCAFYRRCPFTPISEAQYDTLMQQYLNTRAGHPVRSPGDKVDWRAAPPLYRRKK